MANHNLFMFRMPEGMREKIEARKKKDKTPQLPDAEFAIAAFNAYLGTEFVARKRGQPRKVPASE